ncbi:MAG: TonB-dependent copper receptor [Chromatiales bacterium]
MKKQIACFLTLLSPALQAIAADNMIYVEDSLLTPSSSLYETDEVQEAPSSDAGEALRNIPGVSGVRMGGHGIDPIIRGQSQTRLNILLDGAYVHGGCPNRMDPPTAYSSMNSFDEIEVIKGSQTVIYGGGGSGGTVLLQRNTQPLTADEAYRASVSAGYVGNADKKELSADVTAGGQQAYLRGIVDWSEAGNYHDGDDNTVRSAYKSKEGTVILGYLPDSQSRLEFSFMANREDDTLYAGAGMDGVYSDNDTVQLKYQNDGRIGFLDGMKVEIYSSQVDHLMDNFSLRPLSAPMKMSAPSESDTKGGRVLGHINSGDKRWTIGLDHQNNNRNADRFAGPTLSVLQSVLWPDADLKQTGVFAELDTPLDANNQLKAGLRYDRVKASISEANTATSMPASTPATLYALYYNSPTTSATENNVGGFVTLKHKLTDHSAVYATLSRSVRTADATERYIAANSGTAASRWVGNSNLDPEKHHQFEVGYNRKQGNWDMGLSMYYNDVTDYILRDRAHAQSGILLNDNATIYRNVDARLYGFEADAGIRWNRNWSSVATLAYVNAENTSDDRPIAQTPPLEATFNLEYHNDSWRLGGLIRAQDKQTRVEDDITLNSGLDVGKTSGWAVLDLFGNYQVNDSVDIKAGINNVFDTSYAYHVNRASSDPFNPTAVQVYEPGRQIWLGINAIF